MQNLGCALLVLFLIIGAVFTTISNAIGPAPTVIIFMLIVGLLLFWYIQVNGDSAKSKRADAIREVQISKLEELAGNLPYQGPVTLTLAKDEEPVYVLKRVALLETRGNGSTYVGGSQGVSFRVAKGISYRVGSSRGQLVRNPESLQVVDQGTATFTNKRIVFAGSSASREWRFDKMTNIDIGGNGMQVMLAVNNRQKVSGLKWLDTEDLTPGTVLAIANDYFEEGVAAAKERCINTAKAHKALNEGKSEEEASQIGNPNFKGFANGTKNLGELFIYGDDDSEEFDIVGESFYFDNFFKTREKLGARIEDTDEVVLDLVAQPDNPHSKNGKAVAVQYDGLILGHISEESNAEFFDLLQQYGGQGKCKGTIYFAPIEKVTKNSVRLFIDFPLTPSP